MAVPRLVLSLGFVAALAFAPASAQESLDLAKGAARCEEYLAVHKLLSSPSNSLVFSDDRQMRADAFSVGGCGAYNTFPTGGQFAGNYTLLGHQAAFDNDECLVKNSVYSSFQAVVIRSNGFAFSPNAVDLDDIDSLTNVPRDKAWTESMAIFGVRQGQYVLPTTQFYDGTVLASKEYTVTGAAMAEMGFKKSPVAVPGGEYAAEALFNCPFGRDNPESAKCRMTAKFKSDVDTLVILYGVTQKSPVSHSAAVFFSELTLKCGCRCRNNPVTVEGFVPVPGAHGECHKETRTRPSVKCDVMGPKFCSHDVSDTWQVTQKSALASGAYKCALRASKVATVRSEFNPTPIFRRGGE